MSDDQNTPQSPDQSAAPTGPTPEPVKAGSEQSPEQSSAETPTPAPVSAAVSRAEEKAARVKAKADAKLAKIRAKEARNLAKSDAKAARKAQQAESRREKTPASESAKLTEPSPATAEAPAKDQTQAKKETEVKKETGVKKDAQAKVEAPVKDQTPVKNQTPAKDESAGVVPSASVAASSEAPASEAEPKQTPGAGASEVKPTPAAAAATAGQTPAEPRQTEAKPAEAKPAESKSASPEPAPAGAPATPEPAKPESVKSGPTEGPANSPEQKAAAAAPVAAAEKQAATQATDGPQDSKASRRKRKLEKVRAAAARDAEQFPARRKTGAVLLSLVAVIASAGAVAAGSLVAPSPTESTLPAAVTSLPAGDATSVCAATPQLLKGVDGTDPQFEPGAEEVSSNLRSTVVSDLANRIPGSSLSGLDGSSERTLTDRLDEAEASEAKGASDDGLTGRSATISTANNLDGEQLFSVQPLGQLPSMGSTLRSYQAKDGDLAGLAASSCVTAASTLRFTGLQTSTGSTSVLHLSNPTSTTAQVAVDLRGPDGMIDTSTLQSIVIAPGESRSLVLGGYAQNMASVSATVSSTGGKITAYVQQSALRGLTPSGVDLVAANASASNTQVIPGVWIDSKDNSQKLSAEDSTLVPQLHVAATGSQGAGFTVKVLGTGGEVAATFEDNLAVNSNATTSLDLSQLNGGYYTVVVEADAPVTAAVRMVRGADPEDPSDTAWAVGSQPLSGNQVMSLSANGTGKFVLAAPDSDSSVDAVVVAKDGSLQKAQTLNITAGQSMVFDPREISEDAQAVIFSSDSNAYISQVVLGSDDSIAWAAMPQANAGREGIVVNVGG